MAIERWAQANWQGSLKSGQGRLTIQSGALNAQLYSFKGRFEKVSGTNPEELLAAAHSACFTMALTMILNEAKIEVINIDTKAVVTLEQTQASYAITAVQLETKVQAKDLTNEKLQQLALQAKNNCPVSKLFNTQIHLVAQLMPTQ